MADPYNSGTPTTSAARFEDSMVTTAFELPGYRIARNLGVVRGITVRSRSIVEPWTLSIAAGALWFVVPEGGLALAFILSCLTAAVVAMVPLYRSYGLPQQWRPRPLHLFALARANLPLSVAEGIEWFSRRLDIAILGIFATPTAVGVYYVAQQVASLPQKLKTSFEPILGPVITRNLREGDDPSPTLRLFWCVVLTLVPLAMLFAKASLSTMKTAVVLTAIPFMVILLVKIYGFF